LFFACFNKCSNLQKSMLQKMLRKNKYHQAKGQIEIEKTKWQKEKGSINPAYFQMLL
jgi:hypothetical protein